MHATKIRSTLLPLGVFVAAILLFSRAVFAAPPAEGKFGDAIWFRDDDGTEITATGYGPDDVSKNRDITGVPPGGAFRVRALIRLTQADDTITPRFELKEGTGCTTGNWTVLSPSTSPLHLHLSPNFNDGDPTTQQLAGGHNFVAGKIYEATNPAPPISMLKNQSTEYEWSVQAASDIPAGTTYTFRVTDNGTPLGTYGACPSVTIQPAGGGRRVHTTVTFTGKAFPSAKIAVVDRVMEENVHFDVPVRRDITADAEGTFQVDFVGIAKASHSFGLLIKDKENRTTQTKFFMVNAAGNDLTVKDMLIPPTIDIPQRLVSRGKPVIIVGSAFPGNAIALEINGKAKGEAVATADGSYRFSIETGAFDFGTYTARVRQIDTVQKRESEYSLSTTFVVSRLVEPKIDLSGDGEVNVSDWSIFLSHWGAADTQRQDIIDFNNDGVVNISDFSIFIRGLKK